MIIAAILELINMVSDFLSKYFFFIDSSWISNIVNILAILCLIQGMRLFFSKKNVIEISFLSKRFCVEEKMFNKSDIFNLNKTLLELRKTVN